MKSYAIINTCFATFLQSTSTCWFTMIFFSFFGRETTEFMAFWFAVIVDVCWLVSKRRDEAISQGTRRAANSQIRVFCFTFLHFAKRYFQVLGTVRVWNHNSFDAEVDDYHRIYVHLRSSWIKTVHLHHFIGRWWRIAKEKWQKLLLNFSDGFII